MKRPRNEIEFIPLEEEEKSHAWFYVAIAIFVVSIALHFLVENNIDYITQFTSASLM